MLERPDVVAVSALSCADMRSRDDRNRTLRDGRTGVQTIVGPGKPLAALKNL
jgi:hypothetical protein